MYSQGVEPNLDFSNMTQISEKYEEFTGMKINERSPYSGALVFAAFSGSHQDAIAKGMHWLEEKKPDHWTVHICLSILKTWEETMMQMLSVSTASPARAA